jgi:hypothetical protein
MENNYKLRLNKAAERLRKSAKYEFLPPALEEDVRAFEVNFDVRLPEDYRWFITNVANGIKAVDQWGFDFLTKKDWANYWFTEDEYNPAIPFPLTQRVRFDKEASDKSSVYPYETLYDPEETLYPDGYRFGEVSLAGSGCGADDFLVVKGDEYGNVWIDNYASASEIYPVYDSELDKKRLTFTDWVCLNVRRGY